MNPAGTMSPLLKKLQYKPPVNVYVLYHPLEFEGEFNQMKVQVPVSTGCPDQADLSFVLTFVRSELEIEDTFKLLQDRLKGDSIVWYAFPKKSSRKYTVDIYRDRGWDSLIRAGFVPVRAVSIDEDWTALRFRRVEYIKSMTRTFRPV